MNIKQMAVSVANSVKFREELIALQNIAKAYKVRVKLLTERGTASQKEINKYLKLISDNLEEQQMLLEGKA